MNRTLARYLLVFALISVGAVTQALATFHLMVVQEVFPGTPANPGAQYVMLRMTGIGQTALLTNSTFVQVQDAAGNVLGRFGSFDHNVAVSGVGCSYPTCPAILIGTGAAQTLLGFAFDQIVDAQAGHVLLPLAGGRVCFGSATCVIDCVAWGSFTGANTMPACTLNTCDANLGSPATALSPGFALTRKQFSCPAKENSLDFENRFPHPVSNSDGNANVDPDADGLVNVLDCADNDATALYFPLEVTGDGIANPPTTIMWNPQDKTSGTSTRYDVASGSTGDLAVSGSFSGATCLASNVGGVSMSDSRPNPPPGQSYYYLVRAKNACGSATWGDSGLTPDPRDLLDNPGTFPCF